MANVSHRFLWLLAVLAWMSGCQAQCMCSGVLRGQQFNKLAFEYEERRTLSVVPGFQYDIVCRDDVTEPIWYYNGTKVPNVTNAATYQISEAPQTKTLKFGRFSIDQAGDYTCSKPCGTCTINIVTGNPVLNLDIQSATEEFNSATNILLTYYLMGDPLPTSDNVTWSHNGAPLKFPNSLGVFSIDSLLLITPTFTSNHKGVYTATVTSTAGNGSDSFYFNLESFPVANLSVESSDGSRFNNSDDTYTIPLHSSVNITCDNTVSSDGLLEFTWKKDNLELPPTGYEYTIQTSQDASTLLFKIANLTYAGIYECFIENSVGSHSKKVQIIVDHAPVIS